MSNEFERVKLPYGVTFLDVSVPRRNLDGVYTRRVVPSLPDEAAAILHALRHPTGSQPLVDRLNPGDKVTVIVTDNTRPCPDDRILPVLLAEIEKKVDRRDITIIVALGLHPAMTRDELAAKLSPAVVENYNVINHDPAQTVRLGSTVRGIPVEVHSSVAGADFRISTGFIEPHFFAGFSGGRKSIAPGVSSAASISANHSSRMIEHPLARSGVLEGNPIHEDMVEQARLAGLDFIVNVLLNEAGEITHVVAGDLVRAHEQGCQLARETCGVTLDSPADIVITTNSGAPLDLDFYQTCKGINAAAGVTKKGGIIIVAAACDKGIGPASFLDLHAGAAGPQDVLDKIGASSVQGVTWQNQILARDQVDHDVYLVSSLEDSLAEKMMVTPVSSVEQGIEKALQALGRDARIAVIPEGPMVLPEVAR